jgi:REP element-mobilizing transposase RayT
MDRPRSDFVTSRMRLRDYDYSLPGAYFVTMVTTDRLCLFGTVDDTGMHLSDAGKIMSDLWESIPVRYPTISLDAWVVMPNHLHGILTVEVVEQGERLGDAPSISTVIQWFKTQSTLAYGKGVRESDWPPYPGKLWQPRFHDRVLRDDRELEQKRAYIEANPYRWPHDPDNQGGGRSGRT